MNDKAFNMITNENQATPMTNHISCDCKCKFYSRNEIQIKNRTIKHVNMNVKGIVSAKKYNQNPNTRICENSKFHKSIVDTSVTDCDEIIIVMDNISTKKTNHIPTKKTNTIATNVKSTASINFHSKIVRDFYVLDTILLVIILLLTIIIIFYYYLKQKEQYEIENNQFKKVHIKSGTCYCFDDITKLEDFELNNILKYKNHMEKK